MGRFIPSLAVAFLLSLLIPLHESAAEPASSPGPIKRPAPVTQATGATISRWGRTLQDLPANKALTDLTVKMTPNAVNPNMLVIAVRSCSHLGDLKREAGGYLKRSYCPLNLPIGATIRKITAYPRQTETWESYREVMSDASISVIHVWRETIASSVTRVDEVSGIDEPGFLLGGHSFWLGRDLGSLTINYETEARSPQSAYYATVDSLLMLNVEPDESHAAATFVNKFNRDIHSMIGMLAVEYDPPAE